jgi:hypothetical protein
VERCTRQGMKPNKKSKRVVTLRSETPLARQGTEKKKQEGGVRCAAAKVTHITTTLRFPQRTTHGLWGGCVLRFALYFECKPRGSARESHTEAKKRGHCVLQQGSGEEGLVEGSTPSAAHLLRNEGREAKRKGGGRKPCAPHKQRCKTMKSGRTHTQSHRPPRRVGRRPHRTPYYLGVCPAAPLLPSP